MITGKFAYADPKNDGEQLQETQVFGSHGHDGLRMLPDKTDATRTKSGSHLSNSFVFEPDRNNGSYEITSEPPGPDNAQVDETLVINPRLGMIARDVDGEVTMILNWRPGSTSIPRTMELFSMACTNFKKQETVMTRERTQRQVMDTSRCPTNIWSLNIMKCQPH